MNVRAFSLLAFAGLTFAVFAQSTPSSSDSKPAVVAELFTSEGCSSCPPADALLVQMDGKTYAGAPIIVLSEHVDYWNHDGWRDPFSSEQWTQRQNDYNLRFRLDSVYTPQMVIDGSQQVNGSNGGQIGHAIETAAAQPGKLQITIADASWNNDVLHATVSVSDPSPQAAKGTTLYAVLADDQDTSNVAKGENSGRTLTHVSVVRVLQKVSSLHGPYSGPVEIKLPHGVNRSKMRLIVFAQKGQNGQIFGAAQREV
ncbi:DUF1223 domain-containing protein [Alloacidobacterium dinghuense]|uniref:DUF1223 domain-containing protein n=1 Tax=Alloacidobacterium dinghuense TaxID=2763107 RepID=A0A7G8BJD9_9BACT|nr:DUF1223 domain-containing protein [Alloacidobacterium dinghuense]QNI32659.1 DUF1223 domain-containing protein [Alloacidobacterium dinghuense]